MVALNPATYAKDVAEVRPNGWLPDTGVQAKIRVMGGLTWSVVYGRDLRGGRGVFYTAVTR